MGRFTSFLHFLKTPKGIAFSLVFFAIVFNAVFLMGEVTVSTFSLNDEVLHLTATQEASSALRQNLDPTDFWLTRIGLGFPLFHYYQHLPHVVLAGLDQVTSSFLPLPRLFDISRYLLLVFFPLSVFWAMRRFDFDYLAAGLSALIASLLATNGLYGIEYGSYIWRGYGLYTQLWAMFFLPLALAEIYRTIKKEGSWFWPVFYQHWCYFPICSMDIFLCCQQPCLFFLNRIYRRFSLVLRGWQVFLFLPLWSLRIFSFLLFLISPISTGVAGRNPLNIIHLAPLRF